MAFINSAEGIIKDALVFDSTGESLPSTIQFAQGLEPGSRLFCLLVRHIHVLPVVAEQMLKTSKNIECPFAKGQCADTIKMLLLEHKENYDKLLKSIIPSSIYGSKLIIHHVDMYKEEAVVKKPTTVEAMSAIDRGVTIHSPLHYGDMGDKVYASPEPEPPATTGASVQLAKYNIYIYSPYYFKGFEELFKGVNEYKIIERLVKKENGIQTIKTVEPYSENWISLKNGDIIAGEDFLLIGIRSFMGYRDALLKKEQEQQNNDPKKLQSPLPLSIKDFIEKVRTSHYDTRKDIKIEVLGSELPVFSGQQSFYHLDMYLNYGGCTSIDNHLLFLSYIPDELITIFGKNPEKRAELLTLQRQLELVYNKLTAIELTGNTKFEIERIPILIDQWQNIFSFNNCITENNGKIAKCYIPHYSNVCSSITDTPQVTAKLAEDYYRQAYTTMHLSGFQMIPVNVDKVLNVASNQSLHCFVAVLRRG